MARISGRHAKHPGPAPDPVRAGHAAGPAGPAPSGDATPPVPVTRDWWVIAGMAVAATSATLASFTGLRGLALLTGWPAQLAWLLPVTLDAYAMTAARVWLAPTTRSAAARRFARSNALGAITASIAGNAVYHAVEAGLLHITWPIIVIVGAVPAAVLGLTAHLHALRDRVQTDPATPRSPRSGTGASTDSSTDPYEGSAPEPTGQARRTRRGNARRPRPRTENELLAAAREADRRHRAEHGRPITRDALRAALRVSGARASELRRHLGAEHQPDPVDSGPEHPPTTPRTGPGATT